MPRGEGVVLRPATAADVKPLTAVLVITTMWRPPRLGQLAPEEIHP